LTGEKTGIYKEDERKASNVVDHHICGDRERRRVEMSRFDGDGVDSRSRVVTGL